MKKTISLGLRRWQFPLLLLFGVMPVMLTTLCIHAPEALWGAYLLFAAYALFSGVCLLVPGAKRLPCALVCSLGLVALTFALFSVRSYPLFLLLPAALSALLLYSLPLATRQYESEVPPYVYVVGIGIHVVVHFLHHYFDDYDGISPYAPADRALTLSLIAFVFLLLLSMNRISLENASLARHRLPGAMRSLNTMLTLGFTALSLILAATPAVARAVYQLWLSFAWTVRSIAAWLISLLPASEAVGGGGAGAADMSGLGLEVGETSAFAKLLEKFASVLTMIFLLAGSLFLLYMIARGVIRLMRKLSVRLRAYIASAASDYDDEITDTREDGAHRETRFTFRAKQRSAFYDATPAGRIRHGYARLLRRHPQWAPSATARENLSEGAAQLYERARYSEHPITSEDAERFAAELKKN